jgi:hypothetical protein
MLVDNILSARLEHKRLHLQARRVSEPLTPAMFALLLALTEGERHG